MTDLAPQELNFDFEVQPFIKEAVQRAGGLPLSNEQWVVAKGTWLGQDYNEMAEVSPYTAGLLQRSVSPELWPFLSKIFGIEIKKRTFRRIVESLLANSTAQADSLHQVQISRRIIGTPPSYQHLIPRPCESTELSKLLDMNRMVLVTGVAGIGKTSLISELFHQAKWLPTFQTLIWKYSVSENPLEDIDDLLQILNAPARATIYDFIRTRRVLICLDGIDSWFSSDQNRKEANKLLRRIAETEHNSCFILSSREEVPILDSLSQMGRPAQVFRLGGLDEQQAKALLEPYELTGTKLQEFITSRKGNPQHLHDSAQIAERLYNGNVDPLMNGKTSLITKILRSSYSFTLNRIQELGTIELHVLHYLASIAESLSEDDVLKSVQTHLGYPIAQAIQAIQALKAFGLVSTQDPPASILMIDSVVKKYVQLHPETFSQRPDSV